MPKAKQQEVVGAGLDALVSSISAQLRDTIRRAIEQSVDQGYQAAQALVARSAPSPAQAGKRSPGRPARTATNPCVVPSCGREAAARGLCQTHYSKARRMGFNEDTLNGDQLATLARDGRKARFSGHAG